METKTFSKYAKKYKSNNFCVLALPMAYVWSAAGVLFTGAEGQMSKFGGEDIDVYDPQLGALKHEFIPTDGKVVFLVSRGAAANSMRQLLARNPGHIVLHGWHPTKKQLTLGCDWYDPQRTILTNGSSSLRFTLGVFAMPWAYPDLNNVFYMRQTETDFVAAHADELDIPRSGLATVNRCTFNNCRLIRGAAPFISEAETDDVYRLFYVTGLASANDLPTIAHAMDVSIRPFDKSYSANLVLFEDYTYVEQTEDGFYEHADINMCDLVHFIPFKKEALARLDLPPHIKGACVVLKVFNPAVGADDLEKYLQGGGGGGGGA
jgi:hypothetical protein